MPPELEARVASAKAASVDELKLLLHESSEEILRALLENPNCEEPHITTLLDRLDLPAKILGAIAAHPEWASSEAVRMRLASHPHTPKRVAVALVRQLYLFDLVRLSLLPSAPADIKRLAEEIIVSRIPHLPIGQKLTLARRGPSHVAGALLADGHAQTVPLALNNPFLTESQILKVLAKSGVPERAVAAIAQHPKWSSQLTVRFALVRNPHTPIPALLAFLPQISLKDLKELAGLDDVALHSRKYVRQELARRQTGAGNDAAEHAE